LNIQTDTDSVFVHTHFEHKDLDKAWVLGQKMEHFMNTVTFGDMNFITLELEKSCSPFVLYKKKRYLSRVYESPTLEKSKLDYKGLELTRRDNCKLTQEVLKAIVDHLMSGKDLKGYSEDITSTVRHYCDRLVGSDIPFDHYIIQKSVNFNTKSQNMPHLRAAYRLNARIEAGLQVKEPIFNSQRCPYIIHRANMESISVADQNKLKLGDRSDDPDWIKQKGLVIDRLYYTESMVQNSVNRLCVFLAPVEKERIKLAFREAKRLIRLQLKKQQQMTKYTFMHGWHKPVVKPKKEKEEKRYKQQDIASFFKPRLK